MSQSLLHRSKAIDWAGLGWMFLFFWYFSGVTHLLIQLSGSASFVGFRQALLLSSLWLTPLLMFPARAKQLAAVIGGVLWLVSLASFGYFLVYRQEFSQSVIFILFESNIAEGTEYLKQYFAWWMPLAFAAYGLGAWLLWRKVRPVYLARPLQVAFCLLCFGGSVGYQAVNQYLKNPTWELALENFEKRLEPATPWQLLVGYHAYREQLANMQVLLDENAKLPPLAHLTDATAGQPATLVLVIGESTNRQRMSLYGYGRATSPELDKIRDQLQVFDNVITPRPYTIEALQQVLTFADEEHPDLYLTQPSLLNMMKQAGYKTYWITNQQTLTKRNTMLTTFSQQADEQVYLNNNRAQNARQYDDDVFEPFSKALQDPAPRKLIVVHLLGTHMSYEYRYPEDQAVFDGAPGAPSYLKGDELARYNSYDNAVRFNDYVVAGLIKRFSGTDPNGFLLYLSDHGESVYDQPNPDVLGRNEGAPTAAMYTVPFIVWQSPKWQQAFPRDFSTMLSRPYSSSQLIYTWADLAGLRFEGYDATRSLVSSEFQIRPRLIGDPQQPKSLRNYADAVQQPNETQSALAQKKSQQACEGEPPHCG